MPVVSRFFGIVIRMYYNDHNPPHFHATYGSEEALVGIDPIGLLRGSLPSRAWSMVAEWAALHQAELLVNGDRLRAAEVPIAVPPLDWVNTMLPRIRSAVAVGEYRLHLTFSDGLAGEVDLHDDVVARGGVFGPLEDPAYFARVTVDPEAGTVVWPNGVDLDPDVLHDAVASRKPTSALQT